LSTVSSFRTVSSSCRHSLDSSEIIDSFADSVSESCGETLAFGNATEGTKSGAAGDNLGVKSGADTDNFESFGLESDAGLNSGAVGARTAVGGLNSGALTESDKAGAVATQGANAGARADKLKTGALTDKLDTGA